MDARCHAAFAGALPEHYNVVIQPSRGPVQGAPLSPGRKDPGVCHCTALQAHPHPSQGALTPRVPPGKLSPRAATSNERKNAMPPSKSNQSADPAQSLQKFTLGELEQFTRERSYATNASKDFHLFFVGRDDVHDILKYVLSRVRVSLYLNMFGYDDDELNDIILEKVLDPSITVLITLDKSQGGGKHEKKLLDLDRQKSLAAFNTHFVVGESATHQISHTKGFVADGKVAAEGSTNWSDAGEGTFIVTQAGQAAANAKALASPAGPGGNGYKAQNNTQTIVTDPDTIARFTAELIAEHLAAQNLAAATSQPKLGSIALHAGTLKTPGG